MPEDDGSQASRHKARIRCYVHADVLREDTPEEHVRQRVARSLVEEYGYAKSDLHLNFPIKIGSGRPKYLDIAVFSAGTDHEQENVFIVVEAKREDIRPSSKKQGVDQLKSYLAASVNAKWGLWVGSEMQAYERVIGPSGLVAFSEAVDIPLRGLHEPKRLQFYDLVPASEGLSAVFRRCHNYLHVNGNLGKEKAFFELLKLIFCKVYDEQETSGELLFSISQDERRSELGQRKLRLRIDQLFEAVKSRYPYIFPALNERIELDNRSLAYIVAELQKYSFQQTTSDIKGEAYEEIVGVTSRQGEGAFFTPRNACDMAVEMVFATYKPEERLSLRVLDPACGTGGFLRAALIALSVVIEQQALTRWRGNRAEALKEKASRLKRVCDEFIFGIDRLPELVRAAQMNLAMHGDGSTNVYHANSLVPPGEWDSEMREDIRMGSFDVVLTNPPFGAKLPVDDPHILEQFDLGLTANGTLRGSQPPEHLFVERVIRFLKPGGRAAVVLPDSVLSNPGLDYIRKWLMRKAYVIASVDLPKETFARSKTHTKTSVLILQRFTEAEERSIEESGQLPDYKVFMAIAEKCGWDLRGNYVYVRTPTGEELYETIKRTVVTRSVTGELMETEKLFEELVVDDDLPVIPRLFEQWMASGAEPRWMKSR